MKKLIYIASVYLAVSPSAHGVSTYLFTGSGTPEEQGWALQSGAGHLGGSVSIATQTGGGLSDVLQAETSGMQYHQYSLNTGYSQFLVGARLQIISASHNYADAGFMLSPFGTWNSWGSSPDRLNSVYIDPAEMGFMNLTSSVSVVPGDFHEYAILYRNNLLEVFIDETFTDILGGVASPVLSRNGPMLNPGVIAFGDQTNDLDVNSSYILDYIKFQGLSINSPPPPPPPPPQVLLPTTIWLFMSGLAGLFVAVKRRKCA